MSTPMTLAIVDRDDKDRLIDVEYDICPYTREIQIVIMRPEGAITYEDAEQKIYNSLFDT